MPKRTNEFQKLIAAIESQLAPIGAVVTESKLLKERWSNTEREIDVAIETTIGQHVVLIAIECRDHKRPADIDWIDALIGKYRDLPVEKKVAVSRSGFTRGAIEKARQVNITTVTLEDAIEAKLIPNTQKRKLPVQVCSPDPPDIQMVLKLEDIERYGAYSGDLKRGEVLDATGKSLGILIDLLKKEVHKARVEEARGKPPKFEAGPLPIVTLTFPAGTKITSETGIGYRLLEIVVGQSAKIEAAEIELNSYGYMGIELLVGEIEADEARVRILMIYKEEERRIAFQAQGVISIEFGFSPPDSTS